MADSGESPIHSFHPVYFIAEEFIILCEPVPSSMATAQWHARCKVLLPVPEAIGSREGVSSSRTLRSSSSLCLVSKKVGATSQLRVGRISQRRRSKG